jgi:hypothetical protein
MNVNNKIGPANRDARSHARDSPNPGMNPGMFFETYANFSFMYCLAGFSC